MSCYKNDPFTHVMLEHPQLSYQEFLELLIEFEKSPTDNCLSMFLKGKFNRQSSSPSYHIDCGSAVSHAYSCKLCRIYKTGKYSRMQFLKYVYGNVYSKRGNIILK